MNIFITIGVFFCIGVCLKALLPNTQTCVKALNMFIIHLAYPAVILTIVPNMQISYNILVPALSYWLLIPVVWYMVAFMQARFHWPKSIQYAVFILSICGNTGFLGVPLVKEFLAPESVGYALVYDQFGTFLCTSTLVIFMITQYRSQETKIKLATFVVKLLCFTPFTVLLISLILPIQRIIEPLTKELLFVGGLIVPAAMLAIGLQFSLRISREYLKPLSILLSLKLILLPALIWLVLWLLATPSHIIAGVVFQVAAAPMITAAAILTGARVAAPLVASALGLGTILSLAILPVWAVFLN